MIIYLDIETIPAQDPAVRNELRAAVTPPATYKKAESIAEWLAENREKEAEAAWLRTSFDGGFGHICCIGWAVDDGEPASIFGTHEDEAGMLSDFFGVLKRAYSGTSGMKPVIVGHNVVSFDLPFIWKRAIVHGIKPPFWLPRDPKPWGDTAADTMTMWSGAKDRISLDKLCRVLGLPGKGDGPTGADVWPMVQEGRIKEVAAYCREDVQRTRAIYKRLTFA